VRHLEPGWISNGSVSTGETPNNVAINAAKNIFSQIFPIQKNEQHLDIRTILMSPLISGGISIEAKIDAGEILVICDIGNCGNVNLQLRKHGIWLEVESNVIEAGAEIEKFLRH
jgi:hypothetical protein